MKLRRLRRRAYARLGDTSLVAIRLDTLTAATLRARYRDSHAVIVGAMRAALKAAKAA